MVIVSGCISDSDVRQTVLVPKEIPTPTDTPVVQPTFSGIHSKPATPSPTEVPIADDPVIGRWQLVTDKAYSCGASFNTDSTGHVDCSVTFIPMANEDFTWEKIPDDYNFMRSYNVTRGNGDTYKVMYSEHTGNIVGEFLPDGSYLQKVR